MLTDCILTGNVGTDNFYLTKKDPITFLFVQIKQIHSKRRNKRTQSPNQGHQLNQHQRMEIVY